ncbi:MAG: hypothetical protein GXY32_04080 [Ruminococcaceae bacterium]|nr:hypothetical protein [Oscillospiraceae bacterium]
MWKKWLAVLCAALMLTGLVACSSSTKADGVYTAEADDTYVDSNGYGWRDTLTLTYKDGKVVAAQFESYDADGNAKSVPGNYEGMTPEPSEWIPQLSANVLAASSASSIDGIAGATIASGNAQKLYEAIEKNGKPGETIQVDLS